MKPNKLVAFVAAAGGATTDMAATLAKKLGVSQSKVEAAMQSMRPSGAGKPPGAS